MKIVMEMQKIFNDRTLAITQLLCAYPCIWPRRFGTSGNKRKITAKQAQQLLSQAPGI